MIDNAEVVVVAFGAEGALLYGFFYGTMGLVTMGAVGKVAVGEHSAHLGEEMGEFFGGDVHHAELFDARGVYQVGVLRGVVNGKTYGEYLGKSGCMLAFEAPVADVAHTEVQPWGKGVEEGRFAHT